MRDETINGRTYKTTTEAENWAYRKQMFRDGYGRVEYPHPKGKIVRYLQFKHIRAVGVDEFGDESLPRYEEK